MTISPLPGGHGLRLAFRRFRAGALAACLLSGAASAQTVTVSDVPSCPACRVELRPVLVIGGEGQGLLDWPSSVTRLRDGRWLITFPDQGEPPHLYDASGRFLRAVGRRGSGPGEYRMASAVVPGPGDSLFVLDRVGRVSLLDPDLRYVRSAPTPQGTIAAVWVPESSRLILNASVPDKQRAGLPLHLFDQRGNYLRSFGSEQPVLLPGGTEGLVRALAPSRSGAVWSVPAMRSYQVERWSVDGRLERRLVREPSWFRPVASQELSLERTPAPYVASLAEDGAGRLWVLSLLADRRWKSVLRQVGEGENRRWEITDQTRFRDTMLEIVDPVAGRVIVRVRFDEPWNWVTEDGYLLRVAERADGAWMIAVHRATLVGDHARGTSPTGRR